MQCTSFCHQLFCQRLGLLLRRPGGVLCVKENCVGDGLAFSMDREDSALSRSKPYYEALFKIAGLRVVLCVEQPSLDDDLYPVQMWALE